MSGALIAFDGATLTVTHACGCVSWVDSSDLRDAIDGRPQADDAEAGINYCPSHAAPKPERGR